MDSFWCLFGIIYYNQTMLIVRTLQKRQWSIVRTIEGANLVPQIIFQSICVILRGQMHPIAHMHACILCLIYLIKFYKLLNLINFQYNELWSITQHKNPNSSAWVMMFVQIESSDMHEHDMFIQIVLNMMCLHGNSVLIKVTWSLTQTI